MNKHEAVLMALPLQELGPKVLIGAEADELTVDVWESGSLQRNE